MKPVVSDGLNTKVRQFNPAIFLAAKRIMIIGQPGAGKSTLARVLGNHLSLPVVHIDLSTGVPGGLSVMAQRKTGCVLKCMPETRGSSRAAGHRPGRSGWKGRMF